MNWRIWIILWLAVLLLDCKQKTGKEPVAQPASTVAILEPVADPDGWISLFDGKTTNGWHTYGKKKIGKSWVVKDGSLTLEVESAGDGKTRSRDGGDIITDGEYENFELSIEWNISACGNSGIIFCVNEDDAYERTYHTGPEMQVLDNTCHPDAKIHTHRAGDLYDMIACANEVVKPAGEWNLVQISINDGKTIFILNGEKVVEFTMFGDEWAAMIAKSKFKDMSGFGKFRKGHIALQDHGDAVAYRNIKIRPL